MRTWRRSFLAFVTLIYLLYLSKEVHSSTILKTGDKLGSLACTISYLYRGSLSTTKSGRTCQHWSSQTPHKHRYSSDGDFSDNSVSDAKNFCRDPGNSASGYIWCFTNDPDLRWEECNSTDEAICVHLPSTKYVGTVSTTERGRTCQDWAYQYPHLHLIGTSDAVFPDGSVDEARNYCRDPDFSGYLWCFTTDIKVTWEKCRVDLSACIEPHKYMGMTSTTKNGKICQKWSSQSPHRHEVGKSKSMSYYSDSSLVDAKNHCRDPDKAGVLWCYTTDPSTRWEQCNVDLCGCTDFKKYSGTVAVTISGRTCQAWSNQKPHSHSYVDSHFQEGSMTLAKNYCRDPDGIGYVWCYTTDPDKRWEACNVDLCACTLPSRYTGTAAVTRSGRVCQRWASQSPHEHVLGVNDEEFPDDSIEAAQNYCRDPNMDGYLWCYTTDPNVKWEKCIVDLCGCTGFVCTKTKTCVDTEKRCDGNSDCPDSSDEKNCDSCAPDADVFHCPSARMCLPNRYHCAFSDFCDIEGNVPLCE